MPRKYKMTPTQKAVLGIFRARPGVWMSARDLWHALNPGEVPRGTQLGSMGTSLRHLQVKTPELQVDIQGNDRMYRMAQPFSGHPPDTEDAPSAEHTLLDRVRDTSNDADIIAEALLHYSVNVLPEDAGRALRAAFLAGRESRSSIKRNQKPRPKKTNPAVGTTGTNPNVPAVGPPMPEDLTYDGLVERAKTAYAAQEFTYEEVAQKAGMSPEYVRKILKGNATPTRDTLDKVYAATFPND